MEINENVIRKIISETKISQSQIKIVLKLLEEGNTVPFIARYRKEMTKGLDEEEIRSVSKEYEYGVNLQKRKQDVIRLINEKEMLTEELRTQILNAKSLSEVEDLYRPFKEKKKTRATEAVRKGLKPLSDFIKNDPQSSIEEEAKKYLNEEVIKIEEAIAGALDIIGEEVSDNAEYRKFIKEEFRKNAVISTKVVTKNEKLDERKTYQMYYEYQEPIKRIVPHRILATNRGEKEKILKISVVEDTEKIINYLNKKVLTDNKYNTEYIKQAIVDAYKRLIKGSIEREIRAELKESAGEQAIKIFSMNIENLLLQPPMKNKVVLGVDPAFRTGCKLCALSTTGKVLEIGVIYPHQKKINEVIPEGRIKKSKQKILELCKKYKVDIIAIGNGTASRETETFIAEVINEEKLDAAYVIVNESGASVYSASQNARREFPDYEVEERSAVSIGRRLQDPLSELVKIDPKSIGVGQYQHDVSDKKLTDQLNFVVEKAVNQVGVNINTASEELLQHVSGVSKKTAKNLVLYRDEVGKLKSRKELLKVPSMGPKSYEQAVGFLRIIDGTELLDKTSIHPESYQKTLLVLDTLGFEKEDIGNQALVSKINSINRNELLKVIDIDGYTLDDILDSLISPNRDPRDEFDAPILKKGILKLDDIFTGMELTGTVRNVVDFGAFVDCGLKEDGLVHISKICSKFIKHPSEIVQVGDIVTVWVHNVDLEKKKIALTMKNPTK